MKSVMESHTRIGVHRYRIRIYGNFSDTFDGRLINPGHGLEAMWFIMDLAERFDKPEIIEKATAITLSILDCGWDKKYGDIFYFMDVKGYPPQQLEWDQKLWWIHLETLISLLKGYKLTGSELCLGYLNRQGKFLLT